MYLILILLALLVVWLLTGCRIRKQGRVFHVIDSNRYIVKTQNGERFEVYYPWVINWLGRRELVKSQKVTVYQSTYHRCSLFKKKAYVLFR